MPDSTAPVQSEGAERILRAAAELFAEHGFDGVSMSAVAERAGVCKANVFHHFKNKRALYLAVLNTACEDSSTLLDELVSDQGGFADRLLDFLQAHLRHVYEQAGTSRLILHELLQHGTGRGQELAEQALGGNFSRLVGILREGQASGELRADVDPAIVATMLVGANVLLFLGQDMLRHIPEVTFADQHERYSTMAADILLRGVLASPTGPGPASNDNPRKATNDE